MYKSGWFKWFFALIPSCWSNGIYQLPDAIIDRVALFFYGIGLDYFGKLERYELYIYVAVVWIIQIIWSHIWFRYFRFGPLEWLWRSLDLLEKTTTEKK